MSSYFYAFADQAECGQVLPGIWDQDDEGEPYLIGGCIRRPARWLVEPILSEPDEDGAQTVVTPGTLSEPFVILSPVELPDASAYQIEPIGDVGFA